MKKKFYLVGRIIQSVFNQNFQDFEIIIVDDGFKAGGKDFDGD